MKCDEWGQITFISGSPGQIQQKVDAGEKFDLLIMPTPALAALDTAGKLAAGTRRAPRLPEILVSSDPDHLPEQLHCGFMS
jgi:hypothetical protein